MASGIIRQAGLKRSLFILFVVAIAVGIGFRLTSLDRKLYWHDEVYTSIRAAGLRSIEIGQALFSDKLSTAPEILKFQQFNPDSTVWDTISSLAIEDPQHPPLYYLLARFWMQAFGSSIPVMRLLPVLISLLALPLMYGLALELFGSHLIALLSTAILALSPFDVLFAQIARQYSLLTVMVIASSFSLLRALRLRSQSSWAIYSVANAVGLYAHPFFCFTFVGHGVWMILGKIRQKSEVSGDRTPSTFNFQLSTFFGAIATALLLYSPWIVVLAGNYKRALSSTSWASGGTLDWLSASKVWLLSFTSISFDLFFGIDNPWSFILRMPIFLLTIAGIYIMSRRTDYGTWMFILTSILVPFLILFLPDLILGGRRSTVSRYLIPCYPGIQLAIAYLFGTFLSDLDHRWKSYWQSLLVILFAGSIASCAVSAASNTWWSNIPSYFNAETAKFLNSRPNPILIADEGNGTNLGDVISLSYMLDANVKLLLLKQPEIPEALSPDLSKNFSDQFVFRPGKIRQYFNSQRQTLKIVDGTGGDLWEITE